MGQYNDKNLIKYEETIQLHFDTTGNMAWLTLKNYGVVFHMFPWAPPARRSEVIEITIGIPAGSKRDLAKLLPLKRTIDIGAMLDVFDVIKFQVQLLKLSPYLQGGKVWDVDAEVDAANSLPLGHVNVRTLIGWAFESIGFPMDNFDWDLYKGEGLKWPMTSGNFFSITHDALERLLQPPRGAPWISQQIRETRNQTSPLTAYFPDPNFVIEEQRTKLKPGDKTGKTQNSDPRHIEPIYSAAQRPIWDKEQLFSYKEFLDELDKDREQLKDVFLKGREILNPAHFANGTKYLHKHLPRMDCYGFRGDKRRPAELHLGRFLPAVTRTDEGVAAYKDRAKDIDAALKMNDGGKTYREVMKKLDILTLGVYTADQRFKGYISATTSTAIAKHFANAYSTASNLYEPVYCYAVRCKGGFHLPTEKTGTRKPGDPESWVKSLDAQNAFVHNAEQEVAVAGGIAWSDVVGMRKIRVDENGQFFSGPVFLKDVLRKEYQEKLPKKLPGKQTIHGTEVELWRLPPDDNAFDKLFELFSGRSQGVNHEIFWSYEEAPFDCPPSLMIGREYMEGYRQRLGS